ncbi:phenylalanine--tRNA ligase subunit beta [Patescibacteria group bacterium]|nr:phenylalanine--tRNA ligase subunit beta [Patescibacteria group bacterium]MBU1015984.1 phenylalanine--tRNA ligase subunit beta [Patescibacteria group bacterium]MBU1684807.1 phenylalanine--tRNA ligase subunit beta [Patescibacteria group bacterium]MBU1938777.1 phenylalanine--tRNA ligase subunit beta [Patescibacteria group bacterium]
MKISLDWLGDFITITEKDNQKIKDIITERSAEIETMEAQGDHLDNIVVGKVIEIKKHPNADALQLCMVNDGKENIQVVCGGSNVKEGMLCAFAKIGAVVKWHGSEVVKMERAKIRGEESFGMICASEEVGLEDMFPKTSEKEIVDLSHLNLKVGQPLAKALGLDDVVIDVDNHAITNRSDLFSHRGFAREFVANGLGKWRKSNEYKPPVSSSPAPVELKIEDKDSCSHYMGVYITGIEVAESPEWMKKRLVACGVNPISNIVDITNYIMLELGMPLHAFDLDQVKGKKWTMRKAKKGEKVVTLDEQQHELNGGEIVLDDGHELFDLCGIMGGLSSGISQHTRAVWLHSPIYHPTLIRQGMRGLGHVSDAAIIYEKGLDPALAEDGLVRAVELILELCPKAKVASEVIDVWNAPKENRVIDLSVDRVNLLIGTKLKPKEIEKILSDLGFKAAKAKGGYKVTVPSFRHNDVKRESDVIEEVARIYGFNNIPYKSPVKAIDPVSPGKDRRYCRELKEALTAQGFDEIYTFAFIGPELLDKCGMEVTGEIVEVANPISADISLMRTSLLPRMMDTIAGNLRYKTSFKLFEQSKVYFRKSDTDWEEKPVLVMAAVNEDFRVLQGAVESLGIQVLPPRAKDRVAAHHPGRVGELVVLGKVVGYLYEVHPQIRKNFDIKPRVTVAEVDVQAILDMNIDTRKKYTELPKYPSVQLDVSMVIPKRSMAGDYLNTIQKTDQKLITGVELIDEYTGDKIAADKRGLTYSITYQAPDRTLTEAEVEAVHRQVLERLKKNGAEIR